MDRLNVLVRLDSYTILPVSNVMVCSSIKVLFFLCFKINYSLTLTQNCYFACFQIKNYMFPKSEKWSNKWTFCLLSYSHLFTKLDQKIKIKSKNFLVT